MKLTEGGRLERPNICWICKRTPAVGAPVIDTEKHFEGYPFELNGRLYVCETCATQIAGFFGLVDKNSVEIAQTAQARAEAVVRGVKLRLDTMVAELRDLAADPSVFMEATNGSETAVGRGLVGTEADDGTDGGSVGDTEESGGSAEESVGSEGRAAEVEGSPDTEPARGSKSAATAQPRTRKRASTAA